MKNGNSFNVIIIFFRFLSLAMNSLKLVYCGVESTLLFRPRVNITEGGKFRLKLCFQFRNQLGVLGYFGSFIMSTDEWCGSASSSQIKLIKCIVCVHILGASKKAAIRPSKGQMGRKINWNPIELGRRNKFTVQFNFDSEVIISLPRRRRVMAQ